MIQRVNGALRLSEKLGLFGNRRDACETFSHKNICINLNEPKGRSNKSFRSQHARKKKAEKEKLVAFFIFFMVKNVFSFSPSSTRAFFSPCRLFEKLIKDNTSLERELTSMRLARFKSRSRASHNCSAPITFV